MPNSEALRLANAKIRELLEELGHLEPVAMVGVVAASLTHESNQRLMALMANVAAVRYALDADPPDVAQARDALAAVEREIRRSRHLIHQVGRMLSTKTTFGAVNVHELVADVLEVMARQFGEGKISFATRQPSTTLWARGDRDQLEQVLINLLRNACESVLAAPERRRIRVDTLATAEGNIRIAVHDSGPGLSKEQIPRLFEPAFSTKSGGMGLGLVICRAIITLHGGELHVDQGELGGLSVSFTIKQAESNDQSS